MPTSFKHEGDDRIVIDNKTGQPIEGVIRAQTIALLGPTYTVRTRGLFGRMVEKTIRADIRIERPSRTVGQKPAPPPMQEVVRGVKFPFVPVVRTRG